MSFSRHLIHYCTIKKVTGRTVDNVGEAIKTFSNSTGVSCRYIEKSERLALPRGGYQTIKTARVLFPAGTDIGTDDEITDILLTDGTILQGKPAQPGQATTPAVFRVEEVLLRHSKNVHHVSALLEKVE